MRILVCGAAAKWVENWWNGPSGWRCWRLQASWIAQPEQVAAVMRQRPGLIITATYTHVDNAESHREQAYAVNRDGARHLAGRPNTLAFRCSIYPPTMCSPVRPIALYRSDETRSTDLQRANWRARKRSVGVAII